MGKMKGSKTALQRQMAAAGEFGPRFPARASRKPPVVCTPELFREVVERFAGGETVTVICRDEHMPSPRGFRYFLAANERLRAEWEIAKAQHAEHLMETIVEIADNDAKGPNGLVDNGQVQRDRLRVEVRHLRAAALDPARWGKRSEQTIVGDSARPITIRPAISAPEVRAEIGRLLAETDTSPEGMAMKALVNSGQRLPPEVYDAVYSVEDSTDER